MFRVPLRFSAFLLLAIALLVVALPLPTRADDNPRLPGPFPAEGLRVVDGDTLDVRVTIWIGQSLKVRVRLADVDAPQASGRCAATARLGRAAARWLVDRVVDRQITLRNVRPGKYAGRVIATVHDAEGRDVGAALITERLARPYQWRRGCRNCSARARCANWTRWVAARAERPGTTETTAERGRRAQLTLPAAPRAGF